MSLDHFLSIHDISVYEFNLILDTAEEIKKKPWAFRNKLKDKVLAMIFEKPSLRTRMTFEVGMLQLGGEAVYLSPSDIQMGKRESPYDVAKNLERWVDGIMIRTFAYDTVVSLAKASRIPVINALTELLHPCQAMADFFTLREKKGGLSDLKLAYVGDGNNVAHSLLLASAKAGAQMALATPAVYKPKLDILQMAEDDGRDTGFRCILTADPIEAVKEADVVYTDTWTSMGQEELKDTRIQDFLPYQVNSQLMAEAKPDALFMHCLPAHRGQEVTDDVMDSDQAVVYDQAENRLHVQKTILSMIIGSSQKK
jgi:ornithine carbamoyltransferase